MLASEVAILRQVCHPNIIRLITEQETTDQLFLVMELVEVSCHYQLILNCKIVLHNILIFVHQSILGRRFV